MHLDVKCYATLAKFEPAGGLDMPEAATPRDIMAQLAIDPEEVKIIFVNGRHAPADQPLADGDRVGLFPPVGGG